MKKLLWLGVLLVLAGLNRDSGASWVKDSHELVSVNRRLAGRLVDFTANHGRDNRFWSPAMAQKRDLYVYLPPQYDPNCQYPFIIFMHGFAQDEQLFLHQVCRIDEDIRLGKLPPVIVAAPDGSISGEPSATQPGSFFINSNAGNFEDMVLQDVWDFVTSRYPIRGEREAHVLAGVSMGGFAAFNLGIRHRNAFGVAVGMHPPLNLRWCDTCGNYFSNFDPRYWGWRFKLDNRNEVIAKFYGGAVKLRIGQLIEPLFGFGDEAVAELSRQNPIELLHATGLRNGELEMFVGYAGQDEFNIDAQVDSFLYTCKCKGIGVGVAFEPNGRHDGATANRMWPAMISWLGPKLAPYAPEMKQ
jgi:S-formylglutathione hydrolase FrmB